MTIKFHATFAVGSLLMLLSMQPTAKADTIHVVAGVNSAACAQSVAFICNSPGVSFSADFTTMIIFRDGGFGPQPVVESMTGTLNGYPATGGAGGFLIQDPPRPSNVPLYSPFQSVVNFTSDGVPYSIGYDDEFGASTFMEGPNTFSYITWDATLVQTPEPSSLLLLLLGTGGLLVGLALFKNKSRTGVIA
jgi:PEP-CTERM motif